MHISVTIQNVTFVVRIIHKMKIWYSQHMWTLDSFYQSLLCQVFHLKNYMQDISNATCHQLNNTVLHFYNLWRASNPFRFWSRLQYHSWDGDTDTVTQNKWLKKWHLSKAPKRNLYILLLSFHFCVILHLVFLCRSIRELRKSQDKRFHGALSPKLQMRNYKCC